MNDMNTTDNAAAICPNCGSRMVERTRDTMLLCNPPILQYYWWCACGCELDGRRERCATETE